MRSGEGSGTAWSVGKREDAARARRRPGAVAAVLGLLVISPTACSQGESAEAPVTDAVEDGRRGDEGADTLAADAQADAAPNGLTDGQVAPPTDIDAPLDSAAADIVDGASTDTGGVASVWTVRVVTPGPNGAVDVVGGARAFWGDASATAGADGALVIEGAALGALVRIEPPAALVSTLGTTWLAVDTDETGMGERYAVLAPACAMRFDATLGTGGPAGCDVGQLITLDVPPDALTFADGRPYRGEAEAWLSWSSPMSWLSMAALPGGWPGDGLLAGGLEVRLRSVGETPEPLRVSANRVVGVYLPLAAEAGTDAVVEHFDPTRGRWESETHLSVSRDGDQAYAAFDAAHFSHRRVRILSGDTCASDVATVCLTPTLGGQPVRDMVVHRLLMGVQGTRPPCTDEAAVQPPDGCFRVRAEMPMNFRLTSFRPLSRELFSSDFGVPGLAAGTTHRSTVELGRVGIGCVSDTGSCEYVIPGTPAASRWLELRARGVGRVALMPATECGARWCMPAPAGVPLDVCQVNGRCFGETIIPPESAGAVCGGSGTCVTPVPPTPPGTLQLRVAGAGRVDARGGPFACVSPDFSIQSPTSCAEPITGPVSLDATPETSFGFQAVSWFGDCTRVTGATCETAPSAATNGAPVEIVACFHDGSTSGASACAATYGP